MSAKKNERRASPSSAPRAHTRENHSTNECLMHLRAPGPSLSPLAHLLEFIGEDLYLLLIFVFFLRVL